MQEPEKHCDIEALKKSIKKLEVLQKKFNQQPDVEKHRFKTKEINIETLSRWENTLNSWQWPEDMPGKPRNFDNLPNYYMLHDVRKDLYISKMTYISPIIELIHCLIGDKECSRYHFLYSLNKTNEEFEAWWLKRKD